MLAELSTQPRVVGAKQVKRALGAGRAHTVFLATDADPRVTDPIAAQCGQQGVRVERDCSMKELGLACGIAVGAAVAALLLAE
jgi:large subunit ribosomal protein L7A